MNVIPRFIPNLYSKAITAASNKPFVQKWIGIGAPAAIGTITTLSCATKDGVNCAIYVKQSIGNKDIPDDKRVFVAGMDLVNGVLNVILQLATGLWFNKKVIPSLFEKHIEPKYFSENLAKSIEKLNVKGMTPEVASKVAGGLKKAGKAGFAAAATLLLTQIAIKRVVVPLIATPGAAWIKEYVENKQEQKSNIANQQDTVTFEKNPQVASNVNHENLPKCFQNFIK